MFKPRNTLSGDGRAMLAIVLLAILCGFAVANAPPAPPPAAPVAYNPVTVQAGALAPSAGQVLGTACFGRLETYDLRFGRGRIML